MTNAEALTAIRSTTAHDADTQVTDAQLTVKLDQEYRRLRRQLATRVPTLYEATSAPTISAGNTTIAKPSDFERVRRLEKLVSGTRYYVVPLVDALNANQFAGPVFYEQGANLVVQPVAQAAGTYRLTYVTAPTTGYTTLDVPAGLEDVVIERIAAWVRQRHDEDPSYHLAEAARIYREMMSALVRRYGLHPVSGLVTTQ